MPSGDPACRARRLLLITRAVVAEAVGTFALVFAGAGAIVVDARTHALGHVGVAITLSPARVSGDLHALWVYVLAPLTGASLGGLVYQFVRGEQTGTIGLPTEEEVA
jgi:glycerol uptake facilitator-like aquaporin